MEMKRVHILVSGRVQGVFYRASTREKASQLGLSGWVRNLPDGRVELVAEGPEEQIDALIEWCHKGPPVARVDKVEIDYEEPRAEFDGFRVRY